MKIGSKSIKIILYITIIFFITSCRLNEDENIKEDLFEEYSDVNFNGDELDKIRETFSNKDKINLISTLFYYKIPFKVDSLGVIYVEKALYQNKKEVWNISQKYRDSFWLSNHLGIIKGKGYIEK